MEKVKLVVEKRSQTGKGPARRLRAAGKVPAVFYGKKSEPIKLSVDVRQFKKALDQAGTNPLFDLQIEGDGERTSLFALLKQRQVEPLGGGTVHLDFLEVFTDESIEVTVPVEFHGKSIGVERGGIFQAVARELQISCLPGDLPESIVADITRLDVGHAIHAGDVQVPPGVKLLQDANTVLATVIAPKRGELAAAAGEGEAAASE
ncbi:MAG: 50S ribosomal protein L25 [Deltaproteobacteria bacterium]|nr:50S ribosomal protein L25 [Deltaproteobacteria bacterium]